MCDTPKLRSQFRTLKNGKQNKMCVVCCAYQTTYNIRRYHTLDGERVKQANRERMKKYRDEIIDHYGGKCACCGETEPMFLALDHIHGGGNEHRRSLGGKTASNQAVYLWIRKHGYPENMFQVLCHNCNMAKAYYGVCPHQLKPTLVTLEAVGG